MYKLLPYYCTIMTMPATFSGAAPVPSVWYVCPAVSPLAKAAVFSACAVKLGKSPDCKLSTVIFFVGAASMLPAGASWAPNK